MTDNEIFQFNYKKYNSPDALPQKLQHLVLNAKAAAEHAYAPYSHFQVGCALLLESGKIITGNNQENAAYPSGLCAERTALFFYGSQYTTDPVKQLVVVAKHEHQPQWVGACPCGACRQVLLEYEYRQKAPIGVLFQLNNEQYIHLNSAKLLLPFQFDADALNGSF
jgi:cytidine deaminase